MMPPLHPCSEDLFWYWISERHQIYLNKTAGLPKPWSSDVIFQQYKFVNVFRRLDRTTAWLIEHFLEPNRDSKDLSLLVFNICWFRMFSRWETGAALGWLTEWNPDAMFAKLTQLETPFTGAYIIHSEPGYVKIDSINNVCEELFNRRHELLKIIQESQSMEVTLNALRWTRHIGPFMGYQMVLDMMYTPLLEHATDRETWAVVGPGAYRGLRRLYPEIQMRDCLAAMLDLTEKSKLRRGWHVPPLDVHSIEYTCCEVDKYCRVLYGEGKPRSRYPGL